MARPRAALAAALLLLAALLCAARAPLWLLLAGPLLLGVPHVAADLRYLVLRPGLHRRPALLFAAGLPLLAACARPTLWLGLLAALGALAVARAPARRRLLLAAGCAALLGLALGAGAGADLAFAHLHNLLALAFLLALWPRQRRALLGPLAAIALGAALLWLLPLERLLPEGAPAPAAGLTLQRLEAALAPGLSAGAGARVVLLYAFLQAAHYAAWLLLIPAGQARPRTGRAPLSEALRGLRADLGAPLLLACAAVALALAGWALADAAAARDGYLRLAGFHGHLELAAGALLLAEGLPGEAAAPAAPQPG